MEWVPARKSREPRLHVSTPRKDEILGMMKNDGINDSVCEGYVIDFSTDRMVEPWEVGLGYHLANMRWLSEDTWNLEHNDVELNPDFVEAALAYIDAKRQPVQR